MTEWHKRYRGRRLNGGSFGVIYEIEGMPDVVIKALNPDLESNEDRHRMQREIGMLNALKGSPNIIPISDEQEVNAIHPWYMMPRATSNLADFVKLHDKLDEDVTIAFALQILAGLQIAHKKSILHRDLGPHNILLFQHPDNPLPDIWIADFGLGRDYAQMTKGLTRSIHTGLGQSSFISPEQYKLLSNASVQSDLYSVGALMVYMVTGEDPLRTRVETGLGEITRELMQNKASQRPADADEVITSINQYLRIRNPQRPRKSIIEIGSEFAGSETLTAESVVDLSAYLTRQNRLYTGTNQGDLTFSSYFSPLMELPADLVLVWARVYAAAENVELFLERFEEQLKLIIDQTRWSFRSMTIICRFLMKLFEIDKLRGRITSLIAYTYTRGFSEAYDSLTNIVTTRYDNDLNVIQIARSLSKYADNDTMRSFMNIQAVDIRHAAFMDAYL